MLEVNILAFHIHINENHECINFCISVAPLLRKMKYLRHLTIIYKL